MGVISVAIPPLWVSVLAADGLGDFRLRAAGVAPVNDGQRNVRQCGSQHLGAAGSLFASVRLE